MNRILKFPLYLMAIAILFTSCSEDDDVNGTAPRGEYDGGYFILHEGGGPLSPFTYVDDNGTVDTNAFETANPTELPFGGFNQDMFFSDDRAFVISGQSSSVTILDRFSLSLINTVDTDFENPRYGVVVGNKAFVTNSGDFMSTADDFVTVVDLNDYSTSTIVVGDVVNRIYAANNNVYVLNGSFGSGNAITVINPDSESIIGSIDLGAGNSPDTAVLNANSLYVLANNGGATGSVIEINIGTNAIVNTVSLPASLTTPKHISIDGSTTYFTNGTAVYGYATNNPQISTTPVLEYNSSSSFGAMYGFTVKDGIIYIADAGDFVSNGQAFEYDLNGNLMTTISTGVAPNGFFFND